MDQEVADGHLACHPRVIHLKARQAVGDAVVPADLALIHQYRERGHGKCLAGGAGRKDRVAIHRIGTAEALHAEAARHGDTAILDDSDSHSGYTDLLAQLLDTLLEALRRS